MDLLNESEDLIFLNVKDSGKTLEEFIYSNNISNRLFRKLYRDKSILVNGIFQRKDTVLQLGDIVSLILKEEDEDIPIEPVPIDIIYEDMDLLILNKPPFVVVHPTKSHQQNTLSNGIAYYYHNKGIKRKIRFVNRLDMNTSGILIVAKSSFAHQQVALQFEQNQVEKRYMAVVAGIIEEDENIIDLPIGKEKEDSIKRIVTEKGKEAITRYKVIERYRNATLLDIQLITGRSHQIRVHLNHIGHPIIGDTLYYEPSEYIDRQALHSYYLKLRLLRSKELMEFKAGLPWDIKKLIQYIK